MDIDTFAQYYSERGAGFPLLLLHGNGEDSTYFKNQLDFFSKSYRVIAPDTRGHGRTPRGDASFTLRQFADDLKTLLDSLNISRANLLGFSDGANIALLFALKYPDAVNKLILNGADLYPSGVKTSVQIPICIGYGFAALLSLFDKKAVSKKEMLGLMVTQPSIDPRELSALRMPVLVIAGDRDMIKERHTRLIASSIPDSRLCIIPGTHFIAAENCEAFNSAVMSFLV